MKKVEEYLIKIINIILMITLGLMCIIVFLNVILRYIFNTGIVWSEEAARYLFMLLIFLGTITAARRNEHLGIDFFLQKMNIKFRITIQVITNSILIILMGILANGSLKLIKVNEGNKSMALQMPLSYTYYLLLGFALALILVLVMNIFRLFGEESKNKSTDEERVE